MRGRSSTITIPHRIKSEEEPNQTWGTSRLHTSTTEPISIQNLRKEPGNRFTANRHSLPEDRRFVKQGTDDILMVGKRKTNMYYEESDV